MIARSRLESQLMRLWQSRSWVAWMLTPLAGLYGLLLLIRRALYALGLLQQTRLPVPVIVVGNIFVGGTGKTPFVIWLVEQLRARGWHPGVISRGYGVQVDEVTEVHADSEPLAVGDEPLLIMQRTGVPVVVGRRRVVAGQQLLRAHPDVDILISDDGLQHYALARTLEIQISDSRGYGNGWLLPAGPLREPASRRSDFFVVNAATAVTSNAPLNALLNATPKLLPTVDAHRMTLQAEFAERLNHPSQRQPLSTISSGKRIVAAAGIGHPQRFFDMLSKHGIELADTLALPDHFDYGHNPFTMVSADVILITEKDAVKCARINTLANDARLWVVPVTATIAEPLIDNIVETLRGRSTT
jgi:tetraacyldisaccharide 4'-kinase